MDSWPLEELMPRTWIPHLPLNLQKVWELDRLGALIGDPQQAMERICEKMEMERWSIWSMDFYWKELGTDNRNDDFLFFVKDQSSMVDKRCAIAWVQVDSIALSGTQKNWFSTTTTLGVKGVHCNCFAKWVVARVSVALGAWRGCFTNGRISSMFTCLFVVVPRHHWCSTLLCCLRARAKNKNTLNETDLQTWYLKCKNLQQPKAEGTTCFRRISSNLRWSMARMASKAFCTRRSLWESSALVACASQ